MPHRLMPTARRLTGIAFVLTALLSLGGCGWLMPPPQVRGNHVDSDQLKELVPGTSTRADVTALIGSPTARATFDDNTWLYITETTQPRIGATLAVLSQKVVVLSFDDRGVLRDVRTVDQDQAEPFRMVSRTTPSPGTEASFLQQLFGNIGRFNAAGSSAASTGTNQGGAPRSSY